MHLVTAIIKPHRLEDVTTALKGIDANGVTVSEVQGFGRQRGHTEVYRGSEYNVDFLPKTMVQVVCDAVGADKVADVIADGSPHRKDRDGKIWISDSRVSFGIRTGETGPTRSESHCRVRPRAVGRTRLVRSVLMARAGSRRCSPDPEPFGSAIPIGAMRRRSLLMGASTERSFGLPSGHPVFSSRGRARDPTGRATNAASPRFDGRQRDPRVPRHNTP